MTLKMQTFRITIEAILIPDKITGLETVLKQIDISSAFEYLLVLSSPNPDHVFVEHLINLQ